MSTISVQNVFAKVKGVELAEREPLEDAKKALLVREGDQAADLRKGELGEVLRDIKAAKYY